MKNLLFILIYGFSLPAQSQFLNQWVERQHVVRPGETLRLIARKYFGVKYGVFCLQNQLQLEDPNRISPGQTFEFVSPKNLSNELDRYLSVSLDCSRDQVILNGQKVYSRAADVKKQNAEEEDKELRGEIPLESKASSSSREEAAPSVRRIEGDLNSLGQTKKWGMFKLQSGVSYFDFSETVSPDEGSTGYRSINFLDFSFHSRVGLTESWAFEVEGSSVQGQFIEQEVSQEKKTFRWNQIEFGGVYEINSFRFFNSSRFSNYVLIRGGVFGGSIPFLLRNEVEVITENLNYTGGRLGLEMNQFLGEKWRFVENLSYLISTGDWTSQFGTQGSIQAHRNLFGSWWMGLSWHGKWLKGTFDRTILTSKVDFTLVAFHSTASIVVMKTF